MTTKKNASKVEKSQKRPGKLSKTMRRLLIAGALGVGAVVVISGERSKRTAEGLEVRGLASGPVATGKWNWQDGATYRVELTTDGTSYAARLVNR